MVGLVFGGQVISSQLPSSNLAMVAEVGLELVQQALILQKYLGIFFLAVGLERGVALTFLEMEMEMETGVDFLNQTLTFPY